MKYKSSIMTQLFNKQQPFARVNLRDYLGTWVEVMAKEVNPHSLFT